MIKKLKKAIISVDCSNTTTQGDMNNCVAAEYKEIDEELNQIYQEILKHISDKQEQVNLLKKISNFMN